MWFSSIKTKLSGKTPISSDSLKQVKETQLKNLYTFTEGFTQNELNDFLSLGTSIQYPAGSIIFNENSEANSFYIIVDGYAEVFKQTTNEYNESHTHILSTLKVDDVFGDMALIENKSRSASVRAKTDLTVLCFKLNEIKADHTLNLRLTNNIASILSERLRYTNEVTIKNMEENLNQAIARNALGTFLIALLWLLCIYALSFRELIFVTSKLAITTPLSVCMIFIFAAAILIAMKLTGLPYSRFGITLDDWPKKTLQALVYSIPFALIVLAIKAWLIYKQPNSSHIALFSGAASGVSWRYYFMMIFMYSLFSPVQELITRSGIQTTFYLFLPGNELFRKWNAIILSNLLFATAHSFLSLKFSVLVFVPGLFWGWLFHKQRSLIAVSVSHIALGVWTLFVVGFHDFLK